MKDLMDKYDERLQKMKEMGQVPAKRDSNTSSDDSDDIEDDDNDETAVAPQEQETSRMEFFDPGSGSATTVEVQEMNLEDIHRVSVGYNTLPGESFCMQ